MREIFFVSGTSAVNTIDFSGALDTDDGRR